MPGDLTKVLLRAPHLSHSLFSVASSLPVPLVLLFLFCPAKVTRHIYLFHRLFFSHSSVSGKYYSHLHCWAEFGGSLVLRFPLPSPKATMLKRSLLVVSLPDYTVAWGWCSQTTCPQTCTPHRLFLPDVPSIQYLKSRCCKPDPTTPAPYSRWSIHSHAQVAAIPAITETLQGMNCEKGTCSGGRRTGPG